MLNNKKGNAILIIVAVFAILAMTLWSFIKTTISRNYATHKLGDNLYAREIANSYAILALHYIKSQLRNTSSNSNIREAFSQPYYYEGNKLKGSIEEKDIDISDSSNTKSLINTLKEKSDLKDLQLVEKKINWELKDIYPIKVGDDKTGTIPFPREKTGIINLNFDIKYQQPGKKDLITETYNYTSEFKVVANLLPVLSKFTLYVENVFDDGETPDPQNTRRFNVIDTNVTGDLNNTSILVKPWVLNNIGEEESNDKECPNNYKGLVETPRGFVYLGGGTQKNPIKLGIACGDFDATIGNISEYGEDFHFYKKPENEGGYLKSIEPQLWNEGEGILCANLGLCNDDDEDYAQYLELLGETNRKLVKYNSIFKLYGTDNMFARNVFSQTLVFGFVNSMFASIRIFKDGIDNNDFYPLNYYETDTEYLSILFEGNEDYDDDLNTFKEAYESKTNKDLDFNTYHDNFGSRVESLPYNNDFTYAFKKSEPYPFHNSIKDEEIEKLCNPKSDEKTFIRIPNTDEAQYAKIYGDEVKDLTVLNCFIDSQKLSINPNGSRISHTLKLIPPKVEKTRESILIEDKKDIEKILQDYMKSKEILLDEGLDFNGWLYIDSDELDDEFELPLKFGKNLKILSQGGIILSKGHITIEDDIISENNSQLTLLTLGNSGNIKVRNNVNTIHASLISKYGHIYLEDDFDKKKSISLEIKGNIVMHNLGVTSKKDIMEKAGLRRGLNLNYNPNLSAVPNDKNSKNILTEAPILMFNIKENPKSF